MTTCRNNHIINIFNSIITPIVEIVLQSIKEISDDFRKKKILSCVLSDESGQQCRHWDLALAFLF